jgi:hypothetical protein
VDDPLYRACLNIIWSQEIFDFAEHYGDYKALETVGPFACKVHMINVEAVSLEFEESFIGYF